MAEFNTYPLPDLVGLVPEDPKTSNAMRTNPGDPCRHKDDPDSYGIILSRRWIWQDKPMQCEVLWSRQPKIIRVQSTPINAPSRPLRAKWTAEQADDLISGGFVSKAFIRKELFEVEEEYERLSYDEVRKFHEEGADVQLHSDGKVTVKRKTDEPPQDFDHDGRIRHSRVSKRW